MLIEPKNTFVEIDMIKNDIGTCFKFNGEYYVTTSDIEKDIFAFNLSRNDFLYYDDIHWEDDEIELVNLVVVEK